MVVAILLTTSVEMVATATANSSNTEECSKWETEIMDHREADSRTWEMEGMGEAEPDRATLISIRTFLTEAELTWEVATISHRLTLLLEHEGTELESSEASDIKDHLQTQRVRTVVGTVLQEELGLSALLT